MKDRKKSKKCTHIKANGERCRAIPNKETGLCSVHGGHRPRLETKWSAEEIIKDSVCVKKLIGRVMVDVMRGKIAPTTANCLFQGADKLLKCIEITDIQDKLDKMLAMSEQRSLLPAREDVDCLDDLDEDDDIDDIRKED